MPDWKEMAERGAIGLGFDDLIVKDGQSDGPADPPTSLGEQNFSAQGTVNFPFSDEIELLTLHSTAVPDQGSDFCARELDVIEDFDSSVITADLVGGARDEPYADPAPVDFGFDPVDDIDTIASNDFWAGPASELSQWNPDPDAITDDDIAGSVGDQPDSFA